MQVFLLLVTSDHCKEIHMIFLKPELSNNDLRLSVASVIFAVNFYAILGILYVNEDILYCI